MHLINTSKPHSNTIKKEVLRIVLDEPRLYLRESLGSIMVRGEVIVNFPRETYIQGPIQVLFEGIQRFYPWREILLGPAVGSTIETKLQVIELSLLPPDSQGLMPAGVQRFPFEFPIPASLPTTVEIKDRMEIFYQIHATLRRSTSASNHAQSIQDGRNIYNLINWTRHGSQKNVYTATSSMRIVRAMESIITDNNVQQLTPPSITDTQSTRSSMDTISSTTSSIPWNRRNLDHYQGNMDEQHDSIAFSLAGRSVGNLAQPLQCLGPSEGIRYKIGIDRTAIALGTSIGVDIMVQPTCKEVVVKSAVLKVTETRKYTMNVPAGYIWGNNEAETRRTTEQKKMVLKWAYDYSVNNGASTSHYIRKCKSSNKYVSIASSSYSGCLDSKQHLIEEIEDDYIYGDESELSMKSCAGYKDRKLVNLKELEQLVQPGQYFRGRFVMPVPDCSNILHPSMEYETIHIKHWIQLLVTVECDGKLIELNLETPGQVLDCRLVNDDDLQTLIPPPPAYQPGNNDETNWKPSTFWEQRQPITLLSGWGHCVPCPCEARKLKASEIKIKSGASLGEIPSPSQLPEWGPPPSYTTN